MSAACTPFAKPRQSELRRFKHSSLSQEPSRATDHPPIAATPPPLRGNHSGWHTRPHHSWSPRSSGAALRRCQAWRRSRLGLEQKDSPSLGGREGPSSACWVDLSGGYAINKQGLEEGVQSARRGSRVVWCQDRRFPAGMVNQHLGGRSGSTSRCGLTL